MTLGFVFVMAARFGNGTDEFDIRSGVEKLGKKERGVIMALVIKIGLRKKPQRMASTFTY
jgi:hypothetical protein